MEGNWIGSFFVLSCIEKVRGLFQRVWRRDRRWGALSIGMVYKGKSEAEEKRREEKRVNSDSLAAAIGI